MSGFNFYAVTIFRDSFGSHEGGGGDSPSGSSGVFNPHLAAVVTGSVQLVASAGSDLLCDYLGRLPLLIVSSVLMTTALAGFGTFHYFNNEANTGNFHCQYSHCYLIR